MFELKSKHGKPPDARRYMGAAAWVCGSERSWQRPDTGVQVYGCTGAAAWVCGSGAVGSVRIQVYGCTGVRVHGCSCAGVRVLVWESGCVCGFPRVSMGVHGCGAAEAAGRI